MAKIDTIAKYLAEHADAIFTGFAIVGTVSTTALAISATPGALDDLDKAYLEKGESLTKKEVVKATWKRYIPAAVSGTATIGCICAANYAHIRKETALAGMVAFFEQRYSDYQDKVIEVVGEEANTLVENELARDKINANPPKTQKLKADEILCYEPNTDQYFVSNSKEMLWAELTANKIMSMEEKVSLNKILALFANAKHNSKIGDKLGWYLDDSYYEFVGYNWGYYGRPWLDVDPSYIETETGEKVAVLNFSVDPVHEFAYDVEEMLDNTAKIKEELSMNHISEEVEEEKKKSQKKH